MTLREKLRLTEGLSAWKTVPVPEEGLESLFMSDGPHGLRMQDFTENIFHQGSKPATCFPTAVSTACSFDTKLLGEIGTAIAEEANEQGADVVLGPGVNIKRNPLCGRNFEYFSEDPYLAGKLAAGFISALQASGIGGCIKHFACNNQENRRMSSNSALDERTLREIYLTAFEIAIKESSPSSVMAAYNLINGEYCPENKMLLTDILRDEWGFEGLVMSDWTAINNRTESLKAGCDLLMPGCHYYMEKEVAKDVKEGKLKKEIIRRAADRVKAWVRKFGKDGEMYKLRPSSCNYDQHHNIAQKAAEQSAVLLKNTDNILPIKPEQTVSAFGRMYTKLRYQGAGSSLINPTKLSQLSEVIKSDGSAAECDIAVIFTGLPDEYESEGFDRTNLRLPPEDIKLIEETAAVNPNTVVVLFAGGVVETPWIDKVKAVLYMGLPGQAGAEAVKNLLYGFANPCGRLAETWCMEYADTPSADTYGAKNAVYKEGIYVGYRYYEKNAITVRFPFGHGLSYTEFEYSKLTVTNDTVSVRIKNVGNRAGGEAVLMYVAAPENTTLDRPVRELKGFTKVFLEQSAETVVKFTLEPRSFAVWQGKWVIPGGIYTIQIGNQTAEIAVEGDTFAPITYTIPAYDDFPKRPGEFTLNDTPDELAASSLFCKSFCTITEKILLHKTGGVKNNQFHMMYACSVLGPLRATIQAGGISSELANALVDSANGKHIDSAEHLMDLFVAKLKKS
ncbi:MAG: glycoside hydrolase family 3 C-terminal domain-containing protein [Ruminococcus sp.]|jgi:beta-glucosidase|nr:glycoside hydrolase family 3 C-terminal domain-containing protein [Ruminococcus sp.]